jgi:hypothetical protein
MMFGMVMSQRAQDHADGAYVYGIAEGRPEYVSSGIKLHYGSDYSRTQFGSTAQLRCEVRGQAPLVANAIVLHEDVTVPLVERLGRLVAGSDPDDVTCQTTFADGTQITTDIGGQGAFQYPNRRTCRMRNLPCAN